MGVDALVFAGCALANVLWLAVGASVWFAYVARSRGQGGDDDE
jgi:hypothetical protein